VYYYIFIVWFKIIFNIAIIVIRYVAACTIIGILNNISIVVVDMKTNALPCIARYFVVKNQWSYMLTVIVASIALGYLLGRYSSSAAKTYSGTELAASTTAEISVKVWQKIQSKIEEIAGELQDLQAYMSRQKFHVPNTAKR